MRLRTMRRLFWAILVTLVGLPAALAQSGTITFDGEEYLKKFVGMPPGRDKLVEYVRKSESFEKWTRLIGFRYQQLAVIDNDPVKVAQAMARTIKAANPQAQSKIIVSEDKAEAIIDFLTWPPDRSFMEFDIFRYARSRDGKAVVSIQFAHRFTDQSPAGMEKFRKLRQSWIQKAATYDMAIAHREMAH
jgi:hypothetical protein